MSEWQRFNQAETDPTKLTLKMYQYTILNLKKVKELFEMCKFQAGDPYLTKAIFLLTELSLQLPTDEQMEMEYVNEEGAKEFVEDMRNTYFSSLRELEHIKTTRDIRNIDKIITAIKNLYEAYADVAKKAITGRIS